MRNVVCWQCTKYVTGGGDYSGKCQTAVAGACTLAKLNIYGRVLCALGLVVACYVPKYKICVAGQWMTTCPAYT